MKIGQSRGVCGLILGILLLMDGILVLRPVPMWGGWITGYPKQGVKEQIPPQAATTVQDTVGIVFGLLPDQVGGYVLKAGYFVGRLLTLIAPAGSSFKNVLRPVNRHYINSYFSFFGNMPGFRPSVGGPA